MKLFTALLLLVAASLAPSADHSSTLFDDTAVVALELDAPFSRLFADHSRDASVEGTLGYTDPADGRPTIVHDVTITVRGNSSRRPNECTFPKLKLEFPDGGPLFAGIRSVKVGTHCGERADGDLTKLGRWANEKSPLREAFVYRLLGAMGIRTLRARPARITYVDGDRRLVRGAMLLEDAGDGIARLGGAGELKSFTSARDAFAPADAAALAFAEAMIGNFDWAVKFTPDDYYRNDDENPLWNVMAARRTDGTAFPIMYDFDLAGIVTGAHPWFGRVYDDHFLPSRSHPAIETLGQVERTRTLFDRAVLDRTRRRFLAAKADAYRTIAQAEIDDEGRAFARAYLDGFYAAITDADAFYRPVVVQPGTLPYATSAGSAGACGRDDRIPVGTAVGEPLAREGGRVRVPLLDVTWHWASRCDAVHRSPVWVDAGAIGRDYPPR